jgi:hypothetical protein
MNFKDVAHLFVHNSFKVFLICEYSINLPLIFAKGMIQPVNGAGSKAVLNRTVLCRMNAL